MKIGLLVLASAPNANLSALTPLLPLGGQSILQRAVALGRHEKIHTISVVTGDGCASVEAELQKFRVKNLRTVYDKNYSAGLFSSFRAGVHSLPSDLDGVFVLPVGFAAVRPETLERLIAAFVLSRGGCVVYPTYRGKRGYPLLIPYTLAVSVKTYDGGSVDGFLSQYPSENVELDDPGILMGLETQADYDALTRYLASDV